jgi:RNA polymerase sigma factor for flagellar operon FliA
MVEQLKIRRGIAEARDLATYMPVVHEVVGTMLPRLPPNVLRDDLVAAGTFGLLDALRRQTGTARGATFGWYARVRVQGAIIDELRAQDWLSRGARSRCVAEARTCAMIVGIEDLAEEHRAFADERAPTPEANALRNSEARVIAQAIARLPVRERKIIDAHYFGGRQLRAIARDLGVSEPRVSQLRSRAVARLREYLSEAA